MESRGYGSEWRRFAAFGGEDGNQPSEMQDADAVAKRFGFLKVVRGKEDRAASSAECLYLCPEQFSYAWV